MFLEEEKVQVEDKGYILTAQALNSNPVDGQTIYFGQLPKAPSTSIGQNKLFIPKDGIISRIYIYAYATTAGTSEAWVASVRKNNNEEFLVESLSSAANQRVFKNTDLSIPVVMGDYIEIKLVNPTWVTNPAGVTFSSYVFIK